MSSLWCTLKKWKRTVFFSFLYLCITYGKFKKKKKKAHTFYCWHDNMQRSMAFYSSCVWLSSLVLLSFLAAKERKCPSLQAEHSCEWSRSARWLHFTSPLKAWTSWPRVNIPWRPWSPAPCSRHWWSFHLHAACWMLQPSCMFQIWVCTQAHNMTCRLNSPFDQQGSARQKISTYYGVILLINDCIAVIIFWLDHRLPTGFCHK